MNSDAKLKDETPMGIALAEAYVHLNPFDSKAGTFERLYSTARDEAIKTALKVYGPDVVVDLATEEGSWKMWAGVILIGGQVFSWTYDAISKYPDAKKGLKELCQDAQEYGGPSVGLY